MRRLLAPRSNSSWRILPSSAIDAQNYQFLAIKCKREQVGAIRQTDRQTEWERGSEMANRLALEAHFIFMSIMRQYAQGWGRALSLFLSFSLYIYFFLILLAFCRFFGCCSCRLQSCQLDVKRNEAKITKTLHAYLKQQLPHCALTVVGQPLTWRQPAPAARPREKKIQNIFTEFIKSQSILWQSLSNPKHTKFKYA